MNKLEQLALAVGGATLSANGVPDRELFEEAFRLCFPKPESIWVTDAAGNWTDEYQDWQGRQSRFWCLLDEDAYLDAAMSLVPEGADRVFHLFNHKDNFWEVDLGETGASSRGQAATPALALCAAALRARASQDPRP